MPQKLKIVYSVEPDAAALAARAARVFCGRRPSRPWPRSGRARIAISGGSTPKAAFALLADPGAAVARAHAVGPAGPVVGGRALRAAGRPRHQLPHDARGDAGPRAAAARADSPHGGRAGAGGGRGAVRVGAAEQLSPGGRRDAALRPGCSSGWVRMDTLRLFFPTLRPCTSSAGWLSANHVETQRTPGGSR